MDSGNLMIMDPSYLKKGEQPHQDFVMKNPEEQIIKIPHQNKGIIQYLRGVIFNTGFGDGCYEIKAKIINIKGFGERIAEIKITFIEE